MDQSCRWCAYAANRESDHCDECSRHFVDRFTPTLKSTKLHTFHYDNTSTDPLIAVNQAGPGYYVGNQEDPDTLEWVSSLQEASRVLAAMMRQQDH